MPKPRTLIIGVLVAGGLAWGGKLLYDYLRYEETDDAYVTGHIHQISPQADGQVVEVLAHENEPVKAGAVLARLDPLPFEIAVTSAKAGVAQAKAGISRAAAAAQQADSALLEAQARLAQAAAQIAQARAHASLAQVTLNRDRSLARGNAVTPAEMDSARANFDAAQAAVTAAQAEEQSAQAAVAAAQDARTAAAAQQESAAATLQAADAAERDANRKASYVEIIAPAAGIVADKHIETGNRVQTGQQLFALVEPDVWIEANFKETQLADMRPGQPVDVTVDAIPGVTFHARVKSIAPAAASQFALLPADNATGNFTKVVQRLPVRVSFDPAEIQPYAARLRPGLSVEVSVLVH